MTKKTKIFRNIVSVTRWQIGENGIERVFVEWNRIKQTARMKTDGVLQWEMTGQMAERFFYKYGLLTDLK